MSATIKYKGNTIASITTDSSKTLKTSGKYCEADIIVENTKDSGGGSVEPFTKIISGTITFADRTTAFQLPETENFLAAYFIRTDFWGVNNKIDDTGAQVVLFASGQKFGNFSPIHMSSTLYQTRDTLIVIRSLPKLSDGKIMFNVNSENFFYGTYYYSLIYGTK